MPVVPLSILRGILALLSLVFAYQLGRSIGQALRKRPKPRVAGWAVRTLLALLAASWRGGLDRVTITAILLAAVACALGVVLERRPRKQEDLTDVIFPHE
jgi:hypothetical protein